MPRWIRDCFVLSIVVVLLVLRVAPAVAQSAASPQLRASLDSAMHAYVAAGFSGSVLIASHDSLLLDSAYGSVRGRPLRKDDRFWIASTAKQFVSAAVLKCQERGLLTLDDSLGKFFTKVPSDKERITLRQLLSHTSGLAQSYVSEGHSSRDAAVAEMLAEPLAGTAGDRFRYANSNIQLAAAVVETVSRVPYQRFVAEELWLPAGLSATGFAGDQGARLVTSAVGDAPPRLLTRSWGAEGVYSTTGDLYQWYRALRSGRILSLSGVDQLFAPVATISEGQTALAWFLGGSTRGNRIIFTRGNEDFGANSLIYFYPEKEVVIVVLTHSGNAPDQLSWSRRVHAKLQELLAL